jgi:hypothetical protein
MKYAKGSACHALKESDPFAVTPRAPETCLGRIVIGEYCNIA